MNEHQRPWFIFVENREAVIAARIRGEGAGILPAARGFLDGFAGFLLNHGCRAVVEAFPDPRARRTLPGVFFCQSVLSRPLFPLPGFQAGGRVLFRSPSVLRQRGINAVQLEPGFSQTTGRKPVDAEAIAAFFALTEPNPVLAPHEPVVRPLDLGFPWLFRDGGGHGSWFLLPAPGEPRLAGGPLQRLHPEQPVSRGRLAAALVLGRQRGP